MSWVFCVSWPPSVLFKAQLWRNPVLVHGQGSWILYEIGGEATVSGFINCNIFVSYWRMKNVPEQQEITYPSHYSFFLTAANFRAWKISCTAINFKIFQNISSLSFKGDHTGDRLHGWNYMQPPSFIRMLNSLKLNITVLKKNIA